MSPPASEQYGPPDGNQCVHQAAHELLGTRTAVVNACQAVFHYRGATGRVHYTEDSRRMTIVRHKLRPPFHAVIFEDCSSFATGVYWIAGCHDPNGLGFNGAGYTGTLARGGHETHKPQPGDLVFYGHGWPWSHVAVVKRHDPSGTLVYSHGSEGGPRVLPIDYRSDVGQLRSYL